MFEVIVGMEYRDPFTNARRCNEAVERLSDRDPSASRLPVEACSEIEIVQRFQTQDGEGPQMALDPSRFALGPEALKDFGVDDVGKSHRGSIL